MRSVPLVYGPIDFYIFRTGAFLFGLELPVDATRYAALHHHGSTRNRPLFVSRFSFLVTRGLISVERGA